MYRNCRETAFRSGKGTIGGFKFSQKSNRPPTPTGCRLALDCSLIATMVRFTQASSYHPAETLSVVRCGSNDFGGGRFANLCFVRTGVGVGTDRSLLQANTLCG